YSKLEEAMKNKATNPMQLLEASGLTLDEILDFQLRQSENPEKKQIRTLEEKLEAVTKRLQEEDERKRQEGVSREIEGFKSRINQILDGDQERFALIKNTDSSEAVFNAIR